MAKKYDFDYIIIGGGPAGSTAALALARSRQKKIALVEGAALGGSNLNTRDVPYNISLNFSHLYNEFNNCPEIKGQELHYNLPTVVAHQNYIVSTLNPQKTLEEAGITIINGFANFLNAHTIAVGDVKYTATNFILATGATLNTSGITGLESVDYLTPDTAIKLHRLPKSILIVGGGPTGCEIASYYAELGAKVVIMEQADHILPKEDQEVGEFISHYFTHKLGILITLNTKVIAVEPDEEKKKIIFSANGHEKTLRVDHVVFATGTKPCSDYGLLNAGVKVKRSGAVIVNRFFQTTTKNIYAIGDCTGGESSTERSEYEASVLASNLLGRSKNLTNYNGFIRITNTFPEIATVGLNEIKLKRHDRKYRKAIVPFKDLSASKINNFNCGFVKLIVDSSNRIIGATIVGPHAALMAEELSVAIRHQLTALAIASTPHIANSFNYAIKLAAKQLIK